MEAEKKAATPVAAPAELKNEETVYFEQRGDDGKLYSGSFTFRRFTIADLARVGAEINRALGGLPTDSTTELLNTMLVHFKYGVAKAPEWFTPGEAYDVTLYRKVFDALLAFEQRFFPATRRPDEASASAGEKSA